MITNGSVTIEDGTKAAEDYAPARKVSVTISYTTAEGDGADGQAFLDKAADVANAKVNELLGRKQSAKPAAVTAAAPAEVAGKPAKKSRATSAKEPATELNDKEKLAQAAGVLTTDEPTTVELFGIADPEEDSLDDLLGDAAPVPITDAELAKAAQNKNAQMKVKDPNFSVKIRALVVEYAGAPPKKITDVPVAKRQEFLDKLRDLT